MQISSPIYKVHQSFVIHFIYDVWSPSPFVQICYKDQFTAQVNWLHGFFYCIILCFNVWVNLTYPGLFAFQLWCRISKKSSRSKFQGTQQIYTSLDNCYTTWYLRYPQKVYCYTQLQLETCEIWHMSLFRWFKFTLKPSNSIAIGKFRLTIWDTNTRIHPNVFDVPSVFTTISRHSFID